MLFICTIWSIDYVDLVTGKVCNTVHDCNLTRPDHNIIMCDCLQYDICRRGSGMVYKVTSLLTLVGDNMEASLPESCMSGIDVTLFLGTQLRAGM